MSPSQPPPNPKERDLGEEYTVWLKRTIFRSVNMPGDYPAASMDENISIFILVISHHE